MELFGVQVPFDALLIGTTNVPDYERVARDKFQEAVRSRIAPVAVPYNSNYEREMGIYAKGFLRQCRELGIHAAPHAVQIASMWAMSTRLLDPDGKITPFDKVKAYANKKVGTLTENEVLELRRDGAKQNELFFGVSPRDLQQALARSLEHPAVIDSEKGTKCVDPFIVIDALKSSINNTITNISPEDRDKFLQRLTEAEKLVDRMFREDVRRAASGDEKEAQSLFEHYRTNVNAVVNKKKVKDTLSGRDIDPDEKVMREIEGKMDIPDSNRVEFRRQFLEQITNLSLDGKQYTWDTDDKLREAIEEVLMGRYKNLVLSSVGTHGTIPKEQQEKIDIVQSRLTAKQDYCPHCALLALHRSNAPENK